MVGRSQCFNHFSFGVQSFLVKVKSLSAINTKRLLSRDHLINFWEATKRRTRKGWLKRVRWQWNKNNSCNQLSNLGLWPKQGSYDLSDWESQNQQLAPFKQPSSPVTLSSLLSNSIWNIKEALPNVGDFISLHRKLPCSSAGQQIHYQDTQTLANTSQTFLFRKPQIKLLLLSLKYS